MSGRALIVTEDPTFIAEVRSIVGSGVSLTACLGPGQGHCAMEERGSCALADRSDLVVVDVPPGGAFHDHYKGIPAITYAEKLAEAHIRTDVTLCSSTESTGRGAFSTRAHAVSLIGSIRKEGEVDAS